MKDIPTLRKQIDKYGLSVNPVFYQASDQELAAIYNGAGPEDFSETIRAVLRDIFDADPEELEETTRKILTNLLDIFEAAILIHDFDFELSDGTKEGFDKVNDRLKENMLIILDYLYPWWKFWTWKERNYWRLKAYAVYLACDKFGWDAWNHKGVTT